MKVDLTKEQIEFIDYLCFKVQYDYDNYSKEEQDKRETIADEIRCRLYEAEDDNDTLF